MKNVPYYNNKRGRKVLICLAVLLAVWLFTNGMAAAQTVKLKFHDVPESSPCWPYINYLTIKNVAGGFPDGAFHPDEVLTRAQAAKLLVRASGTKEAVSPQPHFTDLSQDHWAYKTIETAAARGLIKGYPDDTFRPGQPVTRAEAVALALRLTDAPLPSLKLPALNDLNTAHWASRPVSVALEIGLMGLAGERIFAPEEPCSRAEMARSLALMMTLSPELRQTPLVGKLVVKKGVVQLTSLNSKEARSVSGHVYLKEGDTLKVAQDGLAEVVFEDGSGIRIEPGTELAVNELNGFTYLGSDGTGKSAVDFLEITLKTGKIFGALATSYERKEEESPAQEKTARLDESSYLSNGAGGDQKPVLVAYGGRDLPFLSGLLAQVSRDQQVNSSRQLPWWKNQYAKRIRVQVNMPWGVAGVRGSFWMNWVTPEGKEVTTVLVGEALVIVAGQTAVIFDGQSLRVVDPQAPLAKPLPMTKEELQAWVEVKQWVTERAQEIQKQLEQNLSTGERNLPPEEEKPVLPAKVADIVNEAIEKAEAAAGTPGTAPSGGGDGGGPPAVTTELVFRPETQQVTVGDTFSVVLKVYNVQDIYGADVQFGFDPGLLQVVNVEAGEEWEGDKGFNQFCYDNDKGQVSLVMTRKNPYPGCSGEVVLATITFQALAPGKNTLSFTKQHDLSNSAPALITHIVKDGSVDIRQGQ